MPKPIVDDNFNLWPERPAPIEDTFVHATEKQINYMEQLRRDLAFSIPVFYMKISGIVGKCVTDEWSLSKSEASQVINKFKEWKEAK